MTIGSNIKTARTAAGVTQARLAEHLGVHQKDVSRWETDRQIPSADTLAKICSYLHVSADMVLGLKKGRG